MVDRRTVLAGLAGVLPGTAGCLDIGGGEGAASPDQGGADTPRAQTPTSEPSYFLTAAPVEADDGLEPVLSTEQEAVAAIEPLMAVIREVTEIFEVTHEPLTPAEAEAFEELTADVEQYFTGNPPGYYFGHEGRRVSVTLGGG